MSEDNRVPSTPTWSRPLRYMVFVMLLAALLAFAWLVREVFPPLIIAGLVAYILMPAVGFLRRRTRLRHGAAVAIVYFGGLVVLGGLPALLLPALIGESQELLISVEDAMANLSSILAQPVQFFDFRINLAPLAPDLPGLLSNALTALTANAFVLVEAVTRNLLWSLVTLLCAYYLLLDWEKLRPRIIELVPPEYQADALIIIQRIQGIWSGYLRGNLLLMLIVGVVFTITWLILGVPGALLLGLLAGLFTIIPDLGPAVAALLAVAVALMRGSTYLNLSNFWFGVLVLGVYLALINVKNIWLRPLIFGHSVHLHPAVVFVAIIAAVVVEGILGALVIVPLLASAMVIAGYLYRKSLRMPAWE